MDEDDGDGVWEIIPLLSFGLDAFMSYDRYDYTKDIKNPFNLEPGNEGNIVSTYLALPYGVKDDGEDGDRNDG